MPKLPPPPRRAHNRSGWLASLARTRSPVAKITSAERQARDASMSHDPGRPAETERLSRDVEVLPQGAGLHPREPEPLVDSNLAHAAKVDGNAAVGERPAADVMTAAAHCHRRPCLPRMSERDGGVICAR